jgi:hypothetical protein
MCVFHQLVPDFAECRMIIVSQFVVVIALGLSVLEQ